MATDVQMTGVPPTTEDGELPHPSVVKQWTADQLFGFAPIQEILCREENQATFKEAQISGNAFLLRGDDLRFWMDNCQLPAGPSTDLADLAQKIKNIRRKISLGDASHFGSDEPANIPTVQSASVSGHGELPTPSVVEQWTRKDVLDYAPIKDILGHPEDWATFTRAKIDGKEFLLRGNDQFYWMNMCQLPAVPSLKLEDLAQRIKNIGKEKRRGNTFHLASDKLTNSFTAEPPTDPYTAERLECLHTLLWGQEERLLDTVFSDFQHPSCNHEANPPLNRHETQSAVKLSLSRNNIGYFLREAGCLPCGANELLARNAYREMYDILLQAQKDRLHDSEKDSISDMEKIILLILGQQGIGKTWFLSYVLVRRLLEGKPTIFQDCTTLGGDSVFTAATDYLIDGNGVRKMAVRPSLFELNNSDIWVLADRTPFGKPREFGEHKWLVVLTTTPREADYKKIVRKCSPRKFYLPTWDWGEVVATA